MIIREEVTVVLGIMTPEVTKVSEFPKVLGITLLPWVTNSFTHIAAGSSKEVHWHSMISKNSCSSRIDNSTRVESSVRGDRGLRKFIGCQ